MNKFFAFSILIHCFIIVFFTFDKHAAKVGFISGAVCSPTLEESKQLIWMREPEITYPAISFDGNKELVIEVSYDYNGIIENAEIIKGSGNDEIDTIALVEIFSGVVDTDTKGKAQIIVDFNLR